MCGYVRPWWHAARTPNYSRLVRSTRMHPRGRSALPSVERLGSISATFQTWYSHGAVARGSQPKVLGTPLQRFPLPEFHRDWVSTFAGIGQSQDGYTERNSGDLKSISTWKYITTPRPLHGPLRW